MSAHEGRELLQDAQPGGRAGPHQLLHPGYPHYEGRVVQPRRSAISGLRDRGPAPRPGLLCAPGPVSKVRSMSPTLAAVRRTYMRPHTCEISTPPSSAHESRLTSAASLVIFASLPCLASSRLTLPSRSADTACSLLSSRASPTVVARSTRTCRTSANAWCLWKRPPHRLFPILACLRTWLRRQSGRNGYGTGSVPRGLV